MNLTSKRIIRGLAVCVGACALSATATTNWVSDSFEEGVADQGINTYKAEEYGQNDTNYLWVSQEGDASKLVATGTDQDGYTLIRPIATATTNLHLQLETEGTTLIRYVDKILDGDNIVTQSVGFTEGEVYIDTMIKFTPSEDDPEIDDEAVKVAVFVNVNSNLVVYHKVYTNALWTMAANTNSVITDQQIDPDAWYRLTIKMGYAGGEIGENACKVFLNQSVLSHDNAYDDDAENGGSWFLLAASGDNVTQVSFQGTGAIDEFVVADEAAGVGATAIMLTLTWAEGDDAKISVVQGATPVTRGGEVTNGVIDISITADWYQVNSVTGTGITYDGNTGSLAQDSSGTITADEGGRTATIAIGQLTGDAPTGLPGDYATVNAADLAAWSIANGLTQENVENNAEAYLDDFLLDVAPGTDATISISSIVVADGIATITVTADCGESEEEVAFATINGTLVVLATDDLTEAFTEVASEDFEITDESATATIEVDVTAGQFIKAKVK